MARLLLKTIYWLAVLAISLVLLVLLVLFFESRDSSRLDDSAVIVGPGLLLLRARFAARLRAGRRATER